MEIAELDESPLSVHVNQSYEIQSIGSSLLIRAPTVWGALYGLETVVQLFGRSPATNNLIVTGLPLHIIDAPAMPWRGLLLDTARHFYSVPVIEKVLDGMAMVKLNVFHWHIIDDQVWRAVRMPRENVVQIGTNLAHLSNRTYLSPSRWSCNPSPRWRGMRRG